ncbi:hypothetical protein SH584_09680 [Sphingomonas sp. LY29]|uniref:hypothetical protein n=1 Tax=Sphingomonas sp. LY29 TaxID=3095341 RepID=UPI002D76912C|nr:hypothetical protein [Sphingomonas sp. LY29]WRP25311.1 hypothetical protein SH584_09680 [Sphingomonas sp. LY29]
MRRRGFLIGGATIAAALLLAVVPAKESPAQRRSIDKQIGNDRITVSVEPGRFAGAVNSLTFRGIEYVDNFDHGRQIQSALQINGLGECLNPTEAGSKADAAKSTTSSKAQSIAVSDNRLTTVTQAAYWLSPGEQYGRRCSALSGKTQAQNRSALSPVLISKTMSFSPLHPNLLTVDVSFSVPSGLQSGSVEALTGYLPARFNSFYSYEPATRRLVRLEANTAGAMVMAPVIIATADRRHAMGVISPDIHRRGFDRSYYAYFAFSGKEGASKWSCVFNESNIPAGQALRYRCPIAVGTVAEVVAALDAFAVAERMVMTARPAPTERSDGKWQFGGAAFTPLRQPAADRIALYACAMKGSGNAFVSTRMDCEMSNPAGMIGYARQSPLAGWVGLNRYYHAGQGRHLISTQEPRSVGQGYALEGILGYLPR